MNATGRAELKAARTSRPTRPTRWPRYEPWRELLPAAWTW